MPIIQLLNLWQAKDGDSFRANPPNADINAVQVGSNSEDPVNLIVQLTNPIYNAEAKTLIYTAKPVSGNPSAMPDSASLTHVNLFIDDVCLNCWWP